MAQRIRIKLKSFDDCLIDQSTVGGRGAMRL
jgi:ribosomal protein S10